MRTSIREICQQAFPEDFPTIPAENPAFVLQSGDTAFAELVRLMNLTSEYPSLTWRHAATWNLVRNTTPPTLRGEDWSCVALTDNTYGGLHINVYTDMTQEAFARAIERMYNTDPIA